MIDPSSGIVTVEWREERGEGEEPDWKTSYSLLVVATTDGSQEIVAPLVIRDGLRIPLGSQT